MDSDAYKEAKRGVEAFGNPGEKGVLVENGSLQTGGVGAEVRPQKDGGGNVVVTFDSRTLNSGVESLQSLVGHEGTHVDDVANGRGESISSWGSEYTGNYVQSVLAEMENEPSVSFGGKGTTFEMHGMGGGILFDPAWGTMTRPQVIFNGNPNGDVRVFVSEDLRRQAIENVLRNGYGLAKP